MSEYRNDWDIRDFQASAEQKYQGTEFDGLLNYVTPV